MAPKHPTARGLHRAELNTPDASAPDFSGVAAYLAGAGDTVVDAKLGADHAASIAATVVAPIETGAPVEPSRSADPVESPAATPTIALAPPPQANPASSTPAAPRHDQAELDRLWPPQPVKRKRELPQRAIAAGAFALLLVVLTLFAAHAAHDSQAAAGGDTADDQKLPQELVVSERDLKHRVQVTADFFRSARHLSPLASAQPAAVIQAPPPPETAVEDRDTDAKRRQRDDDPEDLISHRRTGSSSAEAPASSPTNHRRPYLLYPENNAGEATGTPSAPSPTGALPPAGTTLPVVLATPVTLKQDGSATVIVKTETDSPLPRGSRLIGTATAEGEGRLSLRFHRLLLPDGREAKLDAEAQDDSGAFGVNAVTTGARSQTREVASDVASSTASQAADDVISTFTGGLAGNLLSTATRRASSHASSAPSDTMRLSLSAGAHFNVFLHEAAVERRQ
jgi:hypothetical protein